MGATARRSIKENTSMAGNSILEENFKNVKNPVVYPGSERVCELLDLNSA